MLTSEANASGIQITGKTSYKTPAVGDATESTPEFSIDTAGVHVISAEWYQLIETGYTSPYRESVIHKGRYVLMAEFEIDGVNGGIASCSILLNGDVWQIVKTEAVEGKTRIVAVSPPETAAGEESDPLPADSFSTLIIILFSSVAGIAVIAVIVTLIIIKKKKQSG